MGVLVRRPKSGPVARYGRYAPLIKGVAKLGYRAYKQYSAAKKGRPRKAGNNTSENADGAPANFTSTNKAFSRSYRKKRITRSQKRSIRQVRRFKQVWSKIQGQKSITFNNYFISSTNVDEQGITGICAINGMSKTSGADYGFADLYRIKGTVTGNTDPSQKQRFMINKCFVEIFIKNTNLHTTFVDVYEYVLRRDLEDTGDINLTGVFTRLYNAGTRVVATQETLASLGWSPFEVSAICEKFLILKIDRVQLAAGENVSFKRLFKKRYVPQVSDLTSNPSYSTDYIGRKGQFRGFFMRFAGDMNNSGPGPATPAMPSSVMCYSRRTYWYSTLYDTYNDQGEGSALNP